MASRRTLFNSQLLISDNALEPFTCCRKWKRKFKLAMHRVGHVEVHVVALKGPSPRAGSGLGTGAPLHGPLRGLQAASLVGGPASSMQAAHGPEALGGVDGAHGKGRRDPGREVCCGDGSSGPGARGRCPVQE